MKIDRHISEEITEHIDTYSKGDLCAGCPNGDDCMEQCTAAERVNALINQLHDDMSDGNDVNWLFSEIYKNLIAYGWEVK